MKYFSNNKVTLPGLAVPVLACFVMILLFYNQSTAQCKAPVLKSISYISAESIRISWLYQPNASAYDIEIVRDGEDFTGVPDFALITVNFLEIGNILANARYCLRIRSVCNNQPGEWSSIYCFNSSLSNPGLCSIDFGLQDAVSSSVPVVNKFNVYNGLFPASRLGTDLFIKDVSLIIEHEWPNDLDIELTSPSGKTVVLVSKAGKGTKNFGDPDDLCSGTLRLSDDACLNIEEATILTGEFKPRQSFDELYDQTSPVGNWILNIRDNKYGHAGKLRYFSINFIDNACRLPATYYIEPIGPTRATVRWDAKALAADSLLLEYGPEGFSHGDGKFVKMSAIPGQMTISNLNEGTRYEAYLWSVCGTSLSGPSCPIFFEPLCHPVSFKDKFESATLCENDCESICLISPYWKNADPPYKKWIVHKGKTNTEGTGPKTDFYGFGQYIYVESSENTCEEYKTAILESRCLNIVSNPDGCDLQFSYHMYGADMGTLSLQLSVDGGEQWIDLYRVGGNQGNSWKTHRVDLKPYQGLVGRFRLIADLPENGERSDIALDEIIFFGSFPVSEDKQTYYADVDEDGFGNPGQRAFFCWNQVSSGYAANNNDCDDSDPLINPSVPEIPCNGIDENCNGMTDDLDLQNPMQVIIAEKSDESCEGSSDAYIGLRVTGGQSPYRFQWNDGSDQALLENKVAGAYHCTITDALGCILITEPIELKAGNPMEVQILDQTIASCLGTPDGYILAGQTGGIEPVAYLWNNGHDTNELSGVGPGNYQVTVTDSKGCTAVSQVIEMKASISFDIGYVISPPSCNGDNNGKIEVIGILNGTPPYSFEWSNGSNATKIEDLSPGFYSVTIFDNGQCFEILDSLEVPEVPGLSVQLKAKDDVTCYGSTDGSIEVRAKGGTPPYFYLWYKNNKIFSTDENLFEIGAGVYQLILTDINGCEIVGNPVIVHQPDAVEITIDSITHPSCLASGDGWISALVSGGSDPYTYYWNGNGTNTPANTGLNPGIYTLVVSDKNGCKAYKHGINLESLNVPVVNDLILLDEIKCHGEEHAALMVETAGVKPPIDYNWSNGIRRISDATADTLWQLAAGFYNVTITDAAGCFGTSEWFEVSEPAVLSFKASILDRVRCYGTSTGSIELQVQGGTQPYSILWNNGAETNQIHELPSGNYCADITDAKGCQLKTDSIFLSQPDSLIVNFFVENATGGMNNGRITLIVNGGDTPYDIEWSENAGSQNTSNLSGLAPGTYFVTITDYNGCNVDTFVVITNQVSVSEPHGTSKLKLFPNPTAGWFTVMQTDLTGKAYELRILDPIGKSIHETSGIWPVEGKIEICADTWDAGIYTLIILSGEEYLMTRIIRVR